MLRLPGAPGTVEDRIHQIAIRSVERPLPEACPRCQGNLVKLEARGTDKLPRGMTTTRTFCPACGVEDEWCDRAAKARRS
jgi:hypothetical protein